jgi:aryl-alcohol dehydrogenase-like predicted oxidoreductase
MTQRAGLRQAIAERRDRVILATKFGHYVAEEKCNVTETEDVIPRIRQECEASLRRLGTDYIDLYQFHKADYDPGKTAEVCNVLETLAAEGNKPVEQ